MKVKVKNEQEASYPETPEKGLVAGVDHESWSTTGFILGTVVKFLGSLRPTKRLFVIIFGRSFTGNY